MHCDGKWKSRSHNTSYCSIGHRLSKRYFCKQTIFKDLTEQIVYPNATECTILRPSEKQFLGGVVVGGGQALDTLSKIIRFFHMFVVVASLWGGQKCQYHAIFNQNDIYFAHTLYKI
jgi:hypothetical protein